MRTASFIFTLAILLALAILSAPFGQGAGKRAPGSVMPYELVRQTGVKSWGLSRMSKLSRHDLSANYWYPKSAGSGSTVYIIDFGFRLDHEEFKDRLTFTMKCGILQCYTTEMSDNNGTGTGTQVASIIAGKRYGVAKEAHLVTLEIKDPTQDKARSLISALRWICYQLMKEPANSPWAMSVIVIPFAFVAPKDDKTIEKLEHYQLQIVNTRSTIVSAGGDLSKKQKGNLGDDFNYCDLVVANRYQALIVGGFDENDRILHNANPCNRTNIYAPGNRVIAAAPVSNRAVSYTSGTHAATAYVAGFAALYLTQIGPFKGWVSNDVAHGLSIPTKLLHPNGTMITGYVPCTRLLPEPVVRATPEERKTRNMLFLVGGILGAFIFYALVDLITRYYHALPDDVVNRDEERLQAQYWENAHLHED